MRFELSKGNFRWANSVALVCGVLGAILGVTVILGWHLNAPGLVQLRPGWMPMHYNTALCFFVLSSALLSAILGQTRVPLVGGTLVAVVGMLSSLEYALGTDLGIDQVLFTHSIVTDTSPLARMPPNTAMCFALLGWAVALMGFRVRHGQPSSLAVMLASLTLGLALVALAAYLTDLEAMGGFTRMAVHTAVGFVVLGVGIMVFHWPRTSAHGVDVSRLTGVLISVSTLGVLLIVMLSAAIGLLPFYDQARNNLSDAVSQRLESQSSLLQGLAAQTDNQASGLEREFRLHNETAPRTDITPGQTSSLGTALNLLNSWSGPGIVYLGRLESSGVSVLSGNANSVLTWVSAPPVLAKAIAGGIGGDNGLGHTKLDEDVLAFTRAIQGTDWVAVLLAPASEVYAQADKNLILISMIVMLVALCGAFGIARLMQPLIDGILVHSEELERRVKVATRELKHSLDELQDKNKQLQDFTYIVSHDLQAPLRGIDGFTSLLERKHSHALDEEAGEYLGFIRQGVAQMSSFIQGFLQLSRLGSQSQPMVAVDLNGVVQTLRLQMSYVLEHEQVQLHADNLPTVYADQVQVLQLFQNLLDNAVKFRRPDQGLVINLSAQPSGQRWKINVSDNGLGIDPAEREAVFKMFHRAQPSQTQPGVGMGLALCARIVDRHGGEIEAQETPGGGATFVFSLPATA